MKVTYIGKFGLASQTLTVKNGWATKRDYSDRYHKYVNILLETDTVKWPYYGNNDWQDNLWIFSEGSFEQQRWEDDKKFIFLDTLGKYPKKVEVNLDEGGSFKTKGNVYIALEKYPHNCGNHFYFVEIEPEIKKKDLDEFMDLFYSEQEKTKK